MRSFPHYHQPDMMDCGPTCLRMVAKHYGRSYSLQYLRDRSFVTRTGVSMLGISDAAENIGFRTLGVKINFDTLASEIPLPCIVHWKQNHFVVVFDIKVSNSGRVIVSVADPAHGIIKYTGDEFVRGWISTKTEDEEKGIALILEATPKFYEFKGEKSDRTKIGFFSRTSTTPKPANARISRSGLAKTKDKPGRSLRFSFPALAATRIWRSETTARSIASTKKE